MLLRKYRKTVNIVTFLIRLDISFKGHRCEHRIGNGVFSNKYALS